MKRRANLMLDWGNRGRSKRDLCIWVNSASVTLPSFSLAQPVIKPFKRTPTTLTGTTSLVEVDCVRSRTHCLADHFYLAFPAERLLPFPVISAAAKHAQVRSYVPLPCFVFFLPLPLVLVSGQEPPEHPVISRLTG